jgi:putative spermidine/putrescine transport system substrate-binding protein
MSNLKNEISNQIGTSSVTRKTTRRSVIAKGSKLFGAGALGAGMLGARQAPFAIAKQEPETLRITGWGGGWETLMHETVYPPFEEEYNVKIETDTAFPFPPKLLSSPKDDPIYDVLHSNTNEVQKAYDAGYLVDRSEYTASNVPNVADLYDYAHSDRLPGIAAFTSAVGLGYRTDADLPELTSWKDFWNPELGSDKASYVITNSLGSMLLMMAGDLYGSGYQDLDAAFEAMEKLKPVKLQDFTGTMENVLLSGEANVGVIHDSGIYRHFNDDPVPPIDWVAPEEGTPALEQVLSVTAGSKKKELAYAYINHMLSADVQKAVGEAILYGLANSKVQLAEEFSGKVVDTPEKAAQLIQFDWQWYNENEDEIVLRFNRAMRG